MMSHSGSSYRSIGVGAAGAAAAGPIICSVWLYRFGSKLLKSDSMGLSL